MPAARPPARPSAGPATKALIPPPAGKSAVTYGSVAKAFHWLTALLILTLFPLGLIANDWPHDSSAELATKATLFSIHKTLGVTVFFVALLRILWALTQPKPGALHPDRRVETLLAETVHWLLYISIVVVPLSGWIGHAATTGFAPIWWPFGQDLPFVPKSETVAHLFAGIHEVFTKVLLGAFLLHVAGAAKHQIIDRDLTLARMLPGRVQLRLPLQFPDRKPMWAAFGLYGAALILAVALSFGGGEKVAEPTVPGLLAQDSGWSVEQGTLGISAKQLGSTVAGSFGVWTAAIDFDPEADGAEKGKVTVEIAIPSLTLGSVTAEALKPEFFSATEFPTARYEARILQGDGPDAYVADGVLTLRGVEKPVVLPFTLKIDGDTATMTGATTIDRRDFGIGTTSYGDEKTVAFAVAVDVALTAKRTAP